MEQWGSVLWCCLSGPLPKPRALPADRPLCAIWRAWCCCASVGNTLCRYPVECHVLQCHHLWIAR
jgi:hypothetical protein